MKLIHPNNCVLFTYNPDRDDAIGLFDEDNDRIYINTRLRKLQREIVYYHELTHKECFNTGCKCWGKEFLCEYHAFRGTLRRVIDARSRLSARSWRKLRKCYLSEVDKALEKYRSNQKVWGSHLKALSKLVDTKGFDEL